jgi:mono/diheme cytochrome c family protein
MKVNSCPQQFKLIVASASVVAGFLSFSCTKSTLPQNITSSPAQQLSPEAEKITLLEHGQKLYSQNCIACHNPNPKLDGAVGPAIYGSSLELLKARILKGAYPPRYKPKRPSAQMPVLTGLEKEIPALHAFLNQ